MAFPTHTCCWGYYFAKPATRPEPRRSIARPSASIPNNGQVLLEMARVLITNGDLSGALARLKKAAELTPSAPAVHYQLGTLYRRMGQNDDAERHLNLFRQLQAEQARQAGSDAKPLR